MTPEAVDNLDDWVSPAKSSGASASPEVDQLDDWDASKKPDLVKMGKDMGIIPKSSPWSKSQWFDAPKVPLDENGAVAGTLRALGSVPADAIGGAYDISQGRFSQGAGRMAPAALGAAAVAIPPLGAALAGYGLGSSGKNIVADLGADAPVKAGPNLLGRTLPSTEQAFQEPSAQAGDLAENAIGAAGSAALGAGSMSAGALARTRSMPSNLADLASNGAELGSKAMGIVRSPMKSVQGGLRMAADALRQTPPSAPTTNPNAIPLDTFQRGPAPTRPDGLAPGQTLFTPEPQEVSTFDRSPAPTRPEGLAPGQVLYTPEPAKTSTFQSGPVAPLGAEPPRFQPQPPPISSTPDTFQRGPVAPLAPEPAAFQAQKAPAAAPPETFQRGPVAPLAPEPSRFQIQPPPAAPERPPQVGIPLFARSRSTGFTPPAERFQFNGSAPDTPTRISMDLAASQPKPPAPGGATGMPALQPWVADQLPSATQGLSQSNQQALMEILNRKPNMETPSMDFSPSAPAPVAPAAPVANPAVPAAPVAGVRPTVSLSQIARLLDKVQKGEMSRSDMLGMEGARLKGGKSLKDLPIGKGFSKPGSRPPLDMDESLWNDAREYGQQGK